MRSLILTTGVLVVSTASGAVLGPWPNGSFYMWEDQPLAPSYTSGTVSIVLPGTLQTTPATGLSKNTWFVPCDLTYGGTSYGGDRWTLAKLQGLPGGMKTLHVKAYDPGTINKHGWSLILKDDSTPQKILDFGIWPHAATGKIRPFQYDGTSWYSDPTDTWYTRYKSGGDYYTIDLSQNLDGTLSWTFTGLKPSTGETYTLPGTTNVSYGSITEVYLTGRTQDTNTANYKWTECVFAADCPVPTFGETNPISPASCNDDGASHSVTINGTNFDTGVVGGIPQTSVRLTRSGVWGGIAATNVAVSDANNLTCDISIPPGTSGGAWDVVVTTWCGEVTLPDGFTVNCVPPTQGLSIISPSPAEGTRGQTVAVQITGDRFFAGQTAVKLAKTGQPDIDATGETVIDINNLTCNIPIPAGAAPGSWNLVVTGCDSQILPSGFEVLCEVPSPSVSGIDPSSGTQGVTLTNVAVVGDNFVQGSTMVALTKDGENPIPAEPGSVNVLDQQNLSCTLTLPMNATPGLWNVEVTTCGTGQLPGAFEIKVACNSPPQDADGDLDVDLADFSAFQACFNGPNRPYNPPPVDQQKCRCMDADPDDGDVDLTDFGRFQSCFNGPNRPAGTSC